MAEPIENLRNLGPQSAVWLRGVGIATVAELRQRGPVLVYRLVKARHPQASLNLLWALAAGSESRDWRTLRQDEKDLLLVQLAELE